MSDEITKIVASRFTPESANTAAIIDVAAGSNAVVNLNIQDGFSFFLLDVRGNGTSSDVQVIIQDNTGRTLMQFSEFPDFFTELEYFPVFVKGLKTRVTAAIINSTSVTATITLVINGFTINERDERDFLATLRGVVEAPYRGLPESLKEKQRPPGVGLPIREFN